MWKEVTKNIKAGEYIVKTTTLHPYLRSEWIMKASVHYNDKGKQVWSCKNQKVVEYLDESNDSLERWKNQMGDERKPGSTYVL